MYVKELETNKYLFQFFHEVDIGRVLDGTPWTFNKSPLIVERLKEGENPRNKALNTMEIWVQVYNLEVGFRSDRVLQGVGAYIGQYVSSCPKNFAGIWRDYFRVRVLINVEKPLKRRMRIYKNKVEWFWANFKYERVPTFCFICGIIGHSERFCDRFFEESANTIAKPYGLFMKAPDRRQSKQIGARWLRDNMGQPVEGVAGHSTMEKSDERALNTDHDSEDMMMMEGVIGGVTGGRYFGVNNKSVTSTISMDSNEEREKNGEVGRNKEIQNEGIFNMDLKRRRVNGEEVLGQSSEDIVGPVLNGDEVDVGIFQEGINGESGIFENGVYEKDSGVIQVEKPNGGHGFLRKKSEANASPSTMSDLGLSDRHPCDGKLKVALACEVGVPDFWVNNIGDEGGQRSRVLDCRR
uniref:Zinc knuckle CX2CX4HX4C domain-containing protein n=1 Tax=Cannabis sativa TaxID=3483 RepID=A0A803P5H9_CANSA